MPATTTLVALTTVVLPAQVLNPSFEADQANVVWQACPKDVPAACAPSGTDPCVQQSGLPLVLGCDAVHGRYAHMEICGGAPQNLFQPVSGIELCEGHFLTLRFWARGSFGPGDAAVTFGGQDFEIPATTGWTFYETSWSQCDLDNISAASFNTLTFALCADDGAVLDLDDVQLCVTTEAFDDLDPASGLICPACNPNNVGDLTVCGPSCTDQIGIVLPCEQTCCAGDTNGDGAVDADDLAFLLAAWGTSNALVDFDCNGTVDNADLAFLLAAWGDC